MKKLHLLLSSILFGSFTSALATPYDCVYLGPQVILTGLAGAGPLARADIIAPFARGCDSLFFGDLQGEYGQHHAWYGGGGLAYRKIIDPTRLVGGYLFYDTNESKHSNYFHVISPGVEMISTTWDARVTGYLPVDARTKKDGRNIPPFSDSCGVNVNNDIIEFAGHQEFVGLFSNLEQVGPGLDGEVGYTFARANNLQVHAGGYYFHLRDFSDIKGVEGRIGVPFTPQIKLVAEAGYDNQQRGRIVAGLEFRIGGPRRVDTCNIATHLEDPIMRNLGTVGRGNGIPILSKRVDEGRLVIRDDIFFFSPTGTAVLGAPDAGTFENPFAPTQFSQATVDNIFITTGDGNLYFATGTYTIAGPAAPNEVVTLHDSQSLFGRTSDFRSSAVGAERPILLGGLIFEGNNSLNSIQLINSLVNTGSGRVVAIDMADAPGNQICNSFIQANSTFTGDLTGFNIAIGIHANNSELAIETSTVEANASVIGTITGGLNAATGIGAVGGVAGTATGGEDVLGVGIFALGTDGADGIGTQGADGAAFNQAILFGDAPDGFSSNVTDSFDGNTFTLFETIVNGTASVSADIVGGLNAAVGIGVIGGIGGTGGEGGTNGGVSAGTTVTAGSGGNGFGLGGIGGAGGDSILAITLGNAGDGGDATATASFNDNLFEIDSSQVTSSVEAGTVDTFSANLATAIGSIGGLGGFAGNGGNGGNIFAAVTGGNGGDGVTAGVGGIGGTATFTAIIGDGGNGGDAFVQSTFDNNDFTVTNTDILSSAIAANVPLGLNAAVGIGGISGVGGVGGLGGFGGSVTASTTAGNGGNAALSVEEPTTTGGAGGPATSTLLAGAGGSGGRAATLADFSSNAMIITGSTITITSSVTDSVSSLSANLASGIGSISGISGQGGTGASAGDISSLLTTAGDGGDVAADGTGGAGGAATTIITAGAGGAGGSGNSSSIFGNNSITAAAYTLNALALVQNELAGALNASVGIGSIAGIGGFAGDGADGALLGAGAFGGDGGDAFNIGAVGGDGGDATATITTSNSGNGGSANISAIFAGNTLASNQGIITTVADVGTNDTGFNSSVAIGAIGGFGGSGGNGGLSSSLATVTVGGFNGAGVGGGAAGTASITPTLGGEGNGGNAAIAGVFGNNTLDATGTLAADATAGVNIDALNVAVGVGGVSGFQGIDGLSPVGGGTGGAGSASSLIDFNTMTLDTMTANSNSVVTANTGFSLNEAIGIGTDPLQFLNTSFDNNQVDVNDADWSVSATVAANNDVFSTNKALGLYAGNGTVINFFDSNLNVAANVLGVNLGTNTTQFTQTSGTGIINF